MRQECSGELGTLLKGSQQGSANVPAVTNYVKEAAELLYQSAVGVVCEGAGGAAGLMHSSTATVTVQ